MEFGKTTLFGILVCCLAVCVSGLVMPRTGFLTMKCDPLIECDPVISPICCTDGQTYINNCELDKENQRRFCFEGKFNPIAKVRDGPCNVTTTTPLP